MDHKGFHVLIIGAGIGGLALAQFLRKRGISYEIFERDSAPRVQGWCLTLHTIIEELVQAVPDDVPPLNTTNHLLPLDLPVQHLVYVANDPTDRSFGVTNVDSPQSMERCNRKKLYEWLSHGIDVRRNKKAVAFTEAADGVEVQFEDGSSARGDILVGADGFQSAIRKTLFPGQDLLNTLPAQTLGGEVVLSGDDFARQLELGHSSFTALASSKDPKTGEFRMGSASLFFGLAGVAPDGLSGSFYWILGVPTDALPVQAGWLETASAAELFDVASKIVQAQFHPAFCSAFLKSNVDTTRASPFKLRTLQLDELPIGRVTLLGDAAHCMPPYRGEGAVQSINDSLKLAAIIGDMHATGDKSLDTIKQGMRTYQDEMLQRAAKKVAESIAGGSPDAPRYTWGHAAVDLPVEHIDLDKVPRVH